MMTTGAIGRSPRIAQPAPWPLRDRTIIDTWQRKSNEMAVHVRARWTLDVQDRAVRGGQTRLKRVGEREIGHVTAIMLTRGDENPIRDSPIARARARQQ
jgi:hypothetical protein